MAFKTLHDWSPQVMVMSFDVVSAFIWTIALLSMVMLFGANTVVNHLDHNVFSFSLLTT